MNSTSATTASIAFGRFEVLPHRRELLADNQPVKLGGRAFEVLMVLIESRGAVVSKDELMARVWPDRVVEENNLQAQIVVLRKVFGADRDLIHTVSGRGYQFTGELRIQPSRSDDRVGRRTVVARPGSASSLTNLPASVSELIGREDELADILNLAAAHRLVTLTGPGGIGKTGLAVALARELLPHFADGIWLVELSPVADPELLPATVAAAVGLDLGGGEASTQGVAQALVGRRLLLVLDTCEHVVGAAAALAEAVLRGGTGVQIVATSREPLRAEGEWTYPVPALSVPAVEAAADDKPLEYGAVRLFSERAQAALGRFSPDRRLIANIVAICRRLDGIPLAIELAAARAASLGIEELAAHLDDSFRLLSGGRRTALPRHQTLRATLDWSHQLLAAPERIALRRLAIFAGSFTLDAAVRVIASPEIARPEIVESVASLVEKSLLTAAVEGAAARYRLLDTTRTYALDKLDESGERQTAARRHAEYHRELFERDEAEWETRPTTEWMADYGWRINDLRAALDWAFSPQGDRSIALALAAAAVPLWTQLSLLEECRNWCERALATLDDTDRGTRREMIFQEALALSSMFTRGNSGQVRAAIERGLALAEKLEDSLHQLQLFAGLNIFLTRIGDFRGAVAVAEQAGALAQAANNPADLIMAEWTLGVSHHLAGNQAAAQAHCESGLSRAARLGAFRANFFGYDHRIRALVALARALWLRGFADQAVRVAQQAIDEGEALDHPVSFCIALIYSATVFLWTGDLSRAEGITERLTDHSRRHSLAPYGAVAVGLKGEIAIGKGNPEAGLDMLRNAIETLGAEQHNILVTTFAAASAEGLRKQRQWDEALLAINSAISRAAACGATFDMPELLRIKAHIFADMPGEDRSSATECANEALTLAREQSAMGWELRATMLLARLLSEDGRREQARHALTLIYERFTEGFQTADLLKAQRLIGDLS